MKFIAIQNTYDQIEIALYDDTRCLDLQIRDKLVASKEFVDTLANLLSSHQLAFSSIPFIAVNQGPGPFTTLRVIIASVNGLSFATKIPLVGIDGLNAFYEQSKNSTYPNTVVLLNAFNNDVYFATHAENGYKNISTLLDELVARIPSEPIRFVGNGSALHRDLILETFGSRAHIPDPLPLYCSIEQIAKQGLAQWNAQKNVSYQLMPLYLKKHIVQQ